MSRPSRPRVNSVRSIRISYRRRSRKPVKNVPAQKRTVLRVTERRAPASRPHNEAPRIEGCKAITTTHGYIPAQLL